MVFLHGYPLTHAIWQPQLASLSSSHHAVLLDLPGYGLAHEWPVPVTLAGFAESVHQTLARRFSRRVVLVGHSFGGYVALELLRSHPEQFEALVLTDTRSGADTPEARAKRLATAERLHDPVQTLDVDETVRALVAPTTWERAGPLVEDLRGIVRSVRSTTITRTLEAIAHRADLTPELSKLRLPTLVIWGEEDRLIPPAQTQSMVERIPAGVGIGIPGAGHLPFLEAPDTFAQALLPFLGRLPAVP
ncbi:MAG: alpha/beta hydrolase [Thermoplasmata archaeon]|nr:alpha/beta hydrolase [Thermoplasmata archaeon]